MYKGRTIKLTPRLETARFTGSVFKGLGIMMRVSLRRRLLNSLALQRYKLRKRSKREW